MKSKQETLTAQCETVSHLLKTIAHPLRLKILCVLIEGEKTVSEIEKQCDASQSSVSQYLIKMRLEGLLSSRREAKNVYYQIESLKLKQLMKAMQKIFC